MSEKDSLKGNNVESPVIKKVDLGCLKIPLSGPMSHFVLVFGLLWGCFLVTLVTAVSDPKGPAIELSTGKEFADACRGSILVTVGWCIMYYNFIGTAVIGVFAKNVWEMYGDDDVTDKYGQISGRFAGNMGEHGLVFLVSLWMYTVFADYDSAWKLGVLYLSARLLYPFYYMVFRQFVMWFETNTQIGYGVCGVFMLGPVVQSFGGNWVEYMSASPIAAGVLGFLFGSFLLIPGIPFVPILALVHYKMDHKIAMQKRLP